MVSEESLGATTHHSTDSKFLWFAHRQSPCFHLVHQDNAPLAPSPPVGFCLGTVDTNAIHPAQRPRDSERRDESFDFLQHVGFEVITVTLATSFDRRTPHGLMVFGKLHADYCCADLNNLPYFPCKKASALLQPPLRLPTTRTKSPTWKVGAGFHSSISLSTAWISVRVTSWQPPPPHHIVLFYYNIKFSDFHCPPPRLVSFYLHFGPKSRTFYNYFIGSVNTHSTNQHSPRIAKRHRKSAMAARNVREPR